MSLLAQVLAGAVFGLAFIWAMTVVGTRFSERRSAAAISARQGRLEIDAVRRATLRQLLLTWRQLDRRASVDEAVIDKREGR